MTAREYARAHDIGYAFAAHTAADHPTALDDRDAFDDRVFPDAFADALDALPNLDAADISDAVHAGISDAFDMEV